ncbi:hypothetical protein [Streptomyces sp. NPDC001661]
MEAFGEFWPRYHKRAKSGWLDDLAESARSMAKALDKYADTVDEAISHLRTEIGIAAAAGTAAAKVVIATSASIGVTVSAEIAGVIGMLAELRGADCHCTARAASQRDAGGGRAGLASSCSAPPEPF